MRHSFTKQCVTFGSALLLSLASSQAQAQSDPDANRPQQKALINLESNFISRWMTRDKSKNNSTVDGTLASAQQAAGPQAAAAQAATPAPTASAPSAEPTRKALLPPNSILNRNFPPQTSPTAAATPLPPTTLVFGPAPASPLPGSTPLLQPVTQQPGLQQPGVVPLHQPTMLPGARPMATPIGTTLPAGIAQAQLVAAQSPIVGGQAPVILVVPAGWQPEGPVTFAPRTIMSPEVPAEHWPTVQRNPFGDRVDRGLFTWPKFAKQIAGATLEGQEAPPPTTNSKALFAASNNAPAEAQPPAKALFAPDPNATAVAQPITQSKALFAPPAATAAAAPPVPESRALFARQTAPAAKPASAPTKSRALFAFGRKEEPASEANAQTQVADARVAPAASSTAPTASQATSAMPVDPSEAPPEAPKLSDFDALPSAAAPVPSKPQAPKPAEKKTEVAGLGMKWRAKGSPMNDAMVETVKPADEPEATQPNTTQAEANQPTATPTQIVEQVAPTETQPAAQGKLANGATASAPPQAPASATAPTSAPLPAAPANQKALFASSMFSRGTASAAHALAPSRLAATAPRVMAPPRPAEKAIVPNLMSMVPGLKEVVVGADAAPAASKEVAHATATEMASAPANQHVTQVSTEGQAATARSTQSYYAPAAEYPIEEPQVRPRTVGPQATPVATSSRRKATRPIEEMEVEAADETEDEEVTEESQEDVLEEEPVVTYERRQPIVESPFERQPRKNPTGAGTPSNGARAAEQRTTKTYRRLTTKDVAAGLSRPFNALNQFTKLPPTITRYASDSTNADLEAFEQDARGGYAHNNEDAVTSHPPIKRTPVAQRPAVKANPRESAAVVGDTDGSDAEAGADREAAPTVIRSGRRRVVTPAVVREPAEEEREDDDARAEASEEEAADEPAVKATRIRNKSGASVLIYSGAALSNDRGQATRRVSGIETSDTGRGNPLR
jgi:hypothetical protein